MGHYQLRLVGWYWSRGNLDLRDPFLFRQKWRTGVNRAAEAMTIFAVICAGQFPLIHMGRLWLAFFIFPYPNTRGPLWVNFNSPLLWDVFAISTYFTVSLLFWYTGLVPDFATVRDRAKGLRKKLYNLLAFGWTGSAKHWQRWESLSKILAGLATPLVLSVHTIVSFDFATSVIPGWHTTIFPPYFRGGSDLLRICHGTDPDADHEEGVETGRLYYPGAYRKYEQGNPIDGYDRRGGLPDRAVHCLVLRIHL
jgi:hypothetical protein